MDGGLDPGTPSGQWVGCDAGAHRRDDVCGCGLCQWACLEREGFWSGRRVGVGYWLDGTFPAILGQIELYHLSSAKTNDKSLTTSMDRHLTLLHPAEALKQLLL